MISKKILVFSDCYLYGGSEKLMAFLLKNKILNDNYILLYAYRKHKDYEIGLKNEGLLGRKNNYPLILLSNETLFYQIDCHGFSRPLRILFKLPFYVLQKIGAYSFWNLVVFIILLLTSRPPIIHINNGGYPGAKSCNVLVLANYLTVRAKIIYQVNNQAKKSDNYFIQCFDLFVNKNVSYFINASLRAKQQLIEQRKFDPKKILVIDNCVPLVAIKQDRKQICDLLKIPIDSFIICQVGFLTERKGQRYLIQALKLLLVENPGLREKFSLILVGNGEDQDLLIELITDLGLKENVFLLGYRNDSEDFIAAADIFVLPSISDEDMPLVLLTALGYGKPIIATDFAGISQVIQSGENGILIKKDIDTIVVDLVHEISNLYNSENLRIELSAKAKASYSQYTPDNYGIKLKAIYETVYES